MSVNYLTITPVEKDKGEGLSTPTNWPNIQAYPIVFKEQV